MMIKKAWLAASVMSVGLLYSGLASATRWEWNEYAGDLCQETDSNATIAKRRVVGYWSANQRAECAVSVPLQLNDATYNPQYVWDLNVDGYNGGPATGYNCQPIENQNGILTYGPFQSTSNTGNVSLYWSLPFGTVNLVSGGHPSVKLDCALPNGSTLSGLVDYQVTYEYPNRN